jgi:transposase
MGYFKNIEIDVIQMFQEDGMKETEIATSLGISLTEVHNIIARFEADDYDRDPDVVSYDDLNSEPNDADYNAEHY